MINKFKVSMALVAWLLLVLLAFYYFFLRYIQVFDHRGLYPDGQVNQALLIGFVEAHSPVSNTVDTEIIIYHWVNPNCRCARFSGSYIEQLSQKTTTDNVRHIIFSPPGTAHAMLGIMPNRVSSELIVLSEKDYQRSTTMIPATPAAMIYNRKNKTLSYLGPHTSGVICGKGDSLVEIVLSNLQQGFDPMLFELEQSGCFCDW